jgi:hypothetical protein
LRYGFLKYSDKYRLKLGKIGLRSNSGVNPPTEAVELEKPRFLNKKDQGDSAFRR